MVVVLVVELPLNLQPHVPAGSRGRLQLVVLLLQLPHMVELSGINELLVEFGQEVVELELVRRACLWEDAQFFGHPQLVECGMSVPLGLLSLLELLEPLPFHFDYVQLLLEPPYVQKALLARLLLLLLSHRLHVLLRVYELVEVGH